MEFLIGLSIGLLGIVLAIGIAVYQARSPNITVICRPLSSDDPFSISCTVSNSGRGEGRDVLVGFINMLPVGTKVFAPPESGIELQEVENPPDPVAFPKTSALTLAFSVRVPRVAPKQGITFQVRTLDDDNERAAKQVLKVREVINKTIRRFGECLANAHPEEYAKWNVNAVVNARVKDEVIFKPGYFTYEKGRFPVEFYTDEEHMASAVNQDLYRRYKQKFLPIYKVSKEYKAPVIRIKTSEGDRTYAIFPPYVKTYIQATVSKKELKEKGKLVVYPPVPGAYD